jgi:hypothetical protein
MLYGVLLLAVVFVLPGGAIDGIRRVRSRIVRIIPNPSWLPSASRDEKSTAVATDGSDEHDTAARARPKNPY